MTRPPRLIKSVVLRYAVAIVANAAVVGVNYLLGLREHFSSALFLAAVAATAWYGGLGPGLLATVVAAGTLDYFFVGKPYAFDLGSATWMWLLIFIAVAVFLNLLQESQRRLTAELRTEGRRKSQFMAMLAHELRNFLSPVASAIGVLRTHSANGHAGSELTLEMCDIVDRQIHNMTSLVNDLLDAGRIAQGKLSLSLEPIDLREPISAAIQTVRPIVEERSHLLVTTLPSEPLPLEGDRTRLEQVLVNLLTNAARYTPSGGKIWLTAQRDADELVIRVKDNGTGIAADVLPHVFDLFMQAESCSHGGLGIGLHLVRGLVEKHGGSVVATSDGPGNGCEFVVRLPAASPLADRSTLLPPKNRPAKRAKMVDVPR